jgi:2'-5' RNA ligase
VREIVTALGRYRGPDWTVEEIYLIRSTLDGQPRYETLDTWKLRPAT